MIAGTPCVGFSSVGLQRREEDQPEGQSIEHFMAWAAVCFPFLWHENVEQFKKDILDEALSTLFVAGVHLEIRIGYNGFCESHSRATSPRRLQLQALHLRRASTTIWLEFEGWFGEWEWQSQ